MNYDIVFKLKKKNESRKKISDFTVKLRGFRFCSISFKEITENLFQTII